MKLCLISARKTGEIEMFDMEQTAVKNFQNLMMHEGSQIPVSQISELMEKRRPAYESAASFSVATDGKTPREIAEEIAQKAEWVCGKDNLWNTD